MIGRESLSEVRASIEEGYGLPNSWFSDSAVYQFELERVFDDSWTSIGPLSKLEQAGNTMVAHIGRTPVFVTRDGEGVLRGFVNVCRHRGYSVAEEDGRKPVLICRYHAWTYNLDGSLRNARRCPVQAGDPDFALLPVSVHVARGLVFVNPNPNAEPFDQRHPSFEAVADRQGYDLSGWEYLGTNVFEVAANWKALNENVHECYHCPTIHTHSYGTEFDTEAAEWFTTDDHLWYHRFPYRDVEGASNCVRGLYLYPTAMLFDNGALAGTSYTTPTGPESCRMVSDFVLPPGADRERAAEMREVYVQTLAEDVEVIRRQHIGITSGKVERFVMSDENEPMIRFFHRCLLDIYERGLRELAPVG